ncbi:MAG: ABC transporter ATP-binding protein [Actinomycetaceae bacterium]|nr:ABC transporter ATP-binding protein [Arcanobacterium sp.]MDD7505527.1 ABC transporter ATP-binding protein [Actinomycetaceae bacterium]MDY6143508.1 ABC transporter ATP-binding protein [Arcanobacterium sp.]
MVNESAPALQLIDVSVTYPNGFTPVHAFNLKVSRGEIVGLLGPSGSGKSTVLRAIAGLEPISDGTILIDGEDASDIPTHRRSTGMVFQDAQLFPHRSVGKNIAYGLEAHGIPRAQRQARVLEMLQLVELGGYENRAITTLSGGQAQRVALARSLAPEPRVLLLDEPLSALDRDLRESLAHQLRRILKETGTSAVYVSHDENEAHIVTDRVVRLQSSRS